MPPAPTPNTEWGAGHPLNACRHTNLRERSLLRPPDVKRLGGEAHRAQLEAADHLLAGSPSTVAPIPGRARARAGTGRDGTN